MSEPLVSQNISWFVRYFVAKYAELFDLSIKKSIEFQSYKLSSNGMASVFCF